MTHANSSLRNISRVVASHRQKEGGGFIVRRPLPSPFVPDSVGGLFLLVDELGPINYEPGKAIGAPTHPHLGQCTFTHVLQGEMQHKDSSGGKGTMQNGSMQYMRASGSGILHSEMPSDKMMKEGGIVHGFQIWFNLPASKKLSLPPVYQDFDPEQVPVVSTGPDSFVKPLVGTFQGTSSPVKVDVEGTTFFGYSRKTFNIGFIYNYWGDVNVNGIDLSEGKMAILSESDKAQDTIRLTNITTSTPPMVYPIAPSDKHARVMVGFGPAIDEQITRHGPFVMNTKSEILQAFKMYQEGKMGMIL